MTKDNIIQKATNIIDSYKISSISAMSLNSILQEIGISKGNFYYHFKDKDDLLYQVLSPFIKEHTRDLKAQIKKLNTLKEQIFWLYEPLFVNNHCKTKHIEDMYHFLFFKDGIKSKAHKKLYINILSSRKSLLMQVVKLNNIKLDKNVVVFLDYIENTIAFYYINYKKLHHRSPNSEIIKFLDLACNILEKHFSKQ